MAKESKDLELELLKAKLENLEGKVKKARDPEEEFQERVAKYEAGQEERDKLKQKIEMRRMEIIQEMQGRARLDEALLIESWERRANEVEKRDPQFAKRLRWEIQRKKRDIMNDATRG